MIRVPLDLPLDAPLPEVEEQAAASIAEAQALGADNGVPWRGRIVRARSIGDAIVEAAAEAGADLIVLGSSRPLAEAVPLLLADRGVRPPQGVGRGSDRRLPAGRAEELGVSRRARLRAA